jgi:hypothetical protein
MSMFRPPSKRVRCPPPVRGDRPKEGTFLYDIITQKPITQFVFHKRPVYHQDIYLKALEENNKRLGIPYVEPQLPQSTPYQEPTRTNEPELVYGDRVGVTLRILKNGIVRVKVSGAIATMYEKYYRRGVRAPFKTVLQAYKSHGFSPGFLEKIRKSNEREQVFAKKVPGILAKIFEKEPVKKIKKKKVEETKDEEIDDEPEPEAEVEEDDIPAEEGELDVEPEEEEVVEEEYVSDGDE